MGSVRCHIAWMLKVGLEVLARRVHLQRLAFDGVLRGREVRVLRLGGGDDVIKRHMQRRFYQRDGLEYQATIANG